MYRSQSMQYSCPLPPGLRRLMFMTGIGPLGVVGSKSGPKVIMQNPRNGLMMCQTPVWQAPNHTAMQASLQADEDVRCEMGQRPNYPQPE